MDWVTVRIERLVRSQQAHFYRGENITAELRICRNTHFT